MPRRLKLEPHLDPEGIRQRFKDARDPVEMRRWQVLLLISQDKLTRDIAEATTYHPQTIREIVWRYNARGPDSVHDHRKTSSRRQPPLLNSAQFEALRQAFHESPEDFTWSGADVARWMSRTLGRTIRSQRGWDYLQKLQRAAQDSDVPL